MKKRRVAVLYGGKGCENEVSKMSASYIMSLIDKTKYIVHPIFIDKDGGWYYREKRDRPVSISFAPPRLILSERTLDVDVVLPALHGDMGEDGTISGLIECLGFPYVGCRTVAGAVCSDKALTKAVASFLGIPTTRDVLVCRDDDIECAIKRAEDTIGYPMFIKPTDLGSSVGAVAVYSPRDIRDSLNYALSLSHRVLVEELVEEKRELECACLIARDGEYISNPGEIVLSGTYDYEKKYATTKPTETRVSADIPEDVRERLREYTRKLVRYIGVRQLCRVDYFLTPTGLIFNEINTFPGFTSTSLYARMLEGMGCNPSDLIAELIEGASVL